MACPTCELRMTGQEWQVCETCGEKFRRYAVRTKAQERAYRLQWGLAIAWMGLVMLGALAVLPSWLDFAEANFLGPLGTFAGAMLIAMMTYPVAMAGPRPPMGPKRELVNE